jgi:PAS domain S-box-containing protein
LSEERLRESEERKSAMLQSALDCIISIDHQSKILEFNPAAEQTFGLKHDEVVGRELSELIIPPAFRGLHKQGIERFLATGQSKILDQRLELTALRANGDGVSR